MIDADRVRLGLHRVVELYNPATNQFGTGYGVTDRMVLTAGHVVAGGSTIDARPLCDPHGHPNVEWTLSRPRWVSDDLDVALVELPDRLWAQAPDRGSALWANAGDSVPCLTRGFPWLVGYEDRGMVRDATTARGRAHPDSAVKRGLLTVDVDTTPLPRPLGESASPWGGMSGAAVLAEPGRELLGVVVKHAARHAPGRLLAVPVADLLRDATFARLVAADRTDLRPIIDVPSAAATDFLAPPYRALPDKPVDWQLLMPAHRVVPFHGRDSELGRLRDWWCGTDLLDIAVVVGNGGAGKSRLAAQLCAEAVDAGWHAGVADLAGIGSALRRGDLVLPAPALVVFDYGEQSGTTIAELISRLGHRPRGPRLRLLLVARDGVDGDPKSTVWWRRLRVLTNGLFEERTRLVINLRSAPWPVFEREQQFYAARRAFAPHTEVGATPAPDLEGDQFDNVLLVHIAALLPNDTTPARDQLLSQLLAREQARWLTVPHSPTVHAVLPAMAVQLISCVTLTPPDPGELDALLQAIPQLAANPGLRAELAGWLRSLSSGSDPVPLGPDILVEQLLAETPRLDELVVGIHRTATCDARRASRMVATLLLAAPNRPTVATAVSALLQERLAELVTQALATPEQPLASLLVDALSYAPADDPFLHLAVTTARTVPCPAHGFAGLGIALAAPAIAVASMLTVDLVELATNLATWQLELDQVAQAETTANRAVRAYQDFPNRPGHARAVRLVATCQARTGHNSQALETVRATVHRLIETATDTPASHRLLATTMAEAAVWAMRSSRPLEAADWLVDAIRTLRPTFPIHRHGNAIDADLIELGVRLDAIRSAFGGAEPLNATPLPADRIDHTGDTDLADLIAKAGGALIEMLTAHSDLLRPDQIPLYAESLDVLVSCLTRLSQYDSAFHALDGAIDRYRDLAAAEPARYQPKLADTLRQRGLMLGAEERLPDAREAVAIYQSLCEVDPTTYQPELAKAWVMVGIIHEQLVQPTEVLPAYRNAAALYEPLGEPFEHELAKARGGVAQALFVLGELDEALPEFTAALALLEAHDPVQAVHLRIMYHMLQATTGTKFVDDLRHTIELAREQAANNQDNVDDLAQVLATGSNLLLVAGIVDDAHEYASEAVVLARELMSDEYSTSELGDALTHLARTSLARGQLEQADKLTAEAITLTRPAQVADPGARTGIAHTLCVRCAALVQLGRHSEVIDHAREAIEYLRELVVEIPGDFGQLLEVMNCYAVSLNTLRRPAEARDVLSDLASIANQLPSEFDAPHTTRMTTIVTLVDSLNLFGHHNDAISAAQAALADAVGTPFEPQCQLAMAAAEHGLGQERATYGRHAEAENALSSCVDRLVEIHNRQTVLAPPVEQLLSNTAFTLDHVLRAQGKNVDADTLARTITAILHQ